MADLNFPIAKILHGEVTEQAQANVHRTEMESGPAKVARKQSKSTVTYTVPVVFTADQYAQFKSTWWPSTSQYGSQWFNIDLGEGSVEARSVSGTFEAHPVSPRKTHFRVTLDVEVVL